MDLQPYEVVERFCYLGSLKPVYTHLSGTINYRLCWPVLKPILTKVDNARLYKILHEALHNAYLVRRDEALFILAGYFACDVDIKWKTELRRGFAELITTDDDLFMFCKYSSILGKDKNRKVFSKTVRKAITSWYSARTPEELRIMWLTHRGQHGFNHKTLIRLCHISDEKLGGKEVATPFFKTCTQLLKDSETMSPERSTLAASSVNRDDEDVPMENVNEPKPKSMVEIPSDITLSMSKLRTTKNKNEALRIIKKFNLRLNHVPRHLLKYFPIMDHLLPTMSYMQLLKNWRLMARFNHFDHPKIFRQCQNILENKKLLQDANIYPITLLINMRSMGIRNDISQMAPKRVESLKMHYIKQLYNQSFGHGYSKDRKKNNLRMHITMNFQENYKDKYLRNHKRLTFYDAAIALAFGYFKREHHVDVYHWTEEPLKLEQLYWCPNMDIEVAIARCNDVQNTRNKQRLVVPILNALGNKSQEYDVFLCIVPTAGRGNPGQNSSTLRTLLQKYRTTRNPNAKFVIISLLKFRQSLQYAFLKQENILELCGLDEHTTNIIHNFVTERFN